MVGIAVVAALMLGPVGHGTQRGEVLRELAGEWIVVDADGEPSGLRAEYRTAAGDAGVVETMFTGTPEETLTLYHAEGDRWSATQVNGRGAPARFAETDASDPPAIQLANTALEPGEGSLLGIGIVRLGEDACRVEWTFERGVRRFELRRLADLGRIQEELARLRAGIAGLQRQLDRHLKQEVEVRTGDEGGTRLLETRTLAPGPGWNESGVRLRKFVHEETQVFATSYASAGDAGMTLAHYPFVAGRACRLRFSVMGGHAYIALTEETRAPPRNVRSIPAFSEELLAGDYGLVVERIVGERYRQPRTVEWDLSRFEGKDMRLYLVDVETDHYGQIALSEVRITEEAPR